MAKQNPEMKLRGTLINSNHWVILCRWTPWRIKPSGVNQPSCSSFLHRHPYSAQELTNCLVPFFWRVISTHRQRPNYTMRSRLHGSNTIKGMMNPFLNTQACRPMLRFWKDKDTKAFSPWQRSPYEEIINFYQSISGALRHWPGGHGGDNHLLCLRKVWTLPCFRWCIEILPMQKLVQGIMRKLLPDIHKLLFWG